MKAILTSLLILIGSLHAFAQEAPPTDLPGGLDAEAQGADRTSPLGVRQQRVKRMLTDLESKFAELAEELAAEQPEQAEKLKEAFQQSKELLLMQRMDEITKLLDRTKFESATDEQNDIITDLKGLIDLLLYEEDPFEKLQREIEQLEAWKKALDNLIQEETELKEESEILADPEAAKEDLDAKIAKAKDLVKAQEKLLEETEKHDGSDVDGLDALADQQATLREETAKLADALKPSQEGEAKPSANDAQSKASESLNQATGKQREAVNELANAKPKPAADSEKEAIEKLKEAVKSLEAERERLEQMSPENAAELAEKQSETAGETGELAEEMNEAQDGSEQKPGESSPGENVQNAQQQMNQASEQLAQDQSGQASKNQEQALEELEKARQEVERQLNEKRDEAQQEQIARLQEVFTKMLEKQRLITQGTKTLAEKRGGDDQPLRRRDRITLRELAKGERTLEDDAKEAEALLVEDGTSIVFRDIVGYLQTEIAHVAELMEKRQTGTVVQSAHIEIEMTLQELITALENSGAGQPQQGGQQQQQGGGQQQRQSLFPPIAELKLLKFTQERINRRTSTLERARAANEEIADTVGKQFEDVAGMQNKLTNMARQLAAKLQPTMTADDPDAID